jgi:hypothetical protein
MLQAASELPEIAAVAANAVNGAAVMAVVAMSVPLPFTAPLVTLLAILFGPLAGFFVSSVYSRIAWYVGAKLGGKASLAGLYRIFAWSFLPPALAMLVWRLILLLPKAPSPATVTAVTILFLAVVCFFVWSYWSNVIAAQQLTWIKGAVSVVFTLFLFLVAIVGVAAFFALVLKYGTSYDLKALIRLQ